MRPRQLDLPIRSSSPREGSGARPAFAIEPDPSALPFELEPPAPLPEAPPLPSKPEVLAQARRLAAALSGELGRPVRLSVTDNRSTMLSFRRQADLVMLRVHHMFLGAPPPVVRAVADYAGRGRRAAGSVIDDFIKRNNVRIRAGEGRRGAERLVAQGRVYDLEPIYQRLNLVYFDGRIDARIGWGRGAPTRRRRTIRMGVYDHLTRTIRIHPALDRPEVPAFFVDYIVFHEMLHQAVPATEHGGRKQHHGREFRTRERAYPDYARALAWERENLHLLLGRGAAGHARPVD